MMMTREFERDSLKWGLVGEVSIDRHMDTQQITE
jgi:hypothetical protein